MKRVYLLRHGEADHPSGTSFRSDAERPLTAEGLEKMAAQARGLRALGLPIDAVITSPLVRTRQTAEIVARAYGLEADIRAAEELEPGAALRDIRRALREVPGESLLVVGHAPDLGEAVGELTGGPAVALGKGWLAWIELDGKELRAGAGRLKALLPAQLLVRAGR